MSSFHFIWSCIFGTLQEGFLTNPGVHQLLDTKKYHGKMLYIYKEDDYQVQKNFMKKLNYERHRTVFHQNLDHFAGKADSGLTI